MIAETTRFFRARSLALAVAACAASAAQAGAVALNYDPVFGGTQTTLSYRGSVQFTASDSCVGSAPGLVTVFTASCGGPLLAGATLTLFETSVPSNSTTAFFTLPVVSLRVLDGYIIGFQTGSSAPLTSFYGTAYAGNKDYQLLQIVDGVPTLVSADRCGPAGTCYTNLEVANREGYEGFIIHRNDAGNSPLGTDGAGNAVNWVVGYTGGVVTGAPTTAVPEPASWALFIGGLAAVGLRLSRRRSES